MEADRIPSMVLGTPEMDYGGVALVYLWPPAGTETYLAQAKQRAVAAGWRTTDTQPLGFAARRDGMVLTFVTYPGQTDISVRPDAPMVAYQVGGIAAVLAAVLGWLAAAAPIARYRRVPPRLRNLAQVATVFGVCVPIPATMLNLFAFIGGWHPPNFAPPWFAYEFFLARPGAIGGGMCLCTAWLITIIAKGDQVSAPATR